MSSRLRVLHAIRSDGFAGVERHVAVLARAQTQQGHAVVVIGGGADQMRPALAGSPVTWMPGQTVPKVLQGLIRAGGGADVVHAHMTAAECAAAAASYCPTRGTPLVVTRHFAGPRGSSRLGGLAAKLIVRRSDAQIAISGYVADRVEGASTVIFPGVASADLPSAEREPVVLIAQRLEAEKDTATAIEAFARSELAARGWRLRIAGDGSLRPALERQAAELGIAQSTEFLGMRTDVSELMGAAGLMLAPCAVEGLGLGVLEAMSVGLPVVASRSGGHLETLPQPAHRFCFRPGDAASAAAALRQLAADPEARGALAQQGRQRQREIFVPAAQAERTEAVYRSVIERTGA